MMPVVAGNSALRVLANSCWNLVSFGAGLASQFVVVPFVIQWIGLDAFGVAAMVLAICAPMSLVGTVFGQALICQLSSKTEPNKSSASIKAFTSTAMRWCIVTCAVGWSLIVILGLVMAQPPVNGRAAAKFTWHALLLGATGAVAQQIGYLLQSVSAAQQDYRTIARMSLRAALMSGPLTLGITRLWPHAVGYLAGISAGFILMALFWCGRWKSAISWKIVFSRRTPGESKDLLKFSRWQGAAQLVGVLGNQIDRYALGAMAPASVVGQYSIAQRLQEAAYIGVIKAGEVLFPHFGTISSRGMTDQIEFFQLASWGLGIVSVAMLVPLAILAKSILSLWVGAQAATGADQTLLLLVLGGVVGSASNTFTYYAMGIGRNRYVAGISVLHSTITVILSILLVALFGSVVAGAGLLLASVVRVIASMVLTKRLFFVDLGWPALVVSTVLPVSVGFGGVLVCRCLFQLQFDRWLQIVIMYGALFVMTIFACLLATSLTRAGREIIRSLRKFSRKHNL